MRSRESARWTWHTVSAEEAGRTLQEILTGPLGISRRMIQKLTRASGIRLNGRAAFLGRKLRSGDVVAARLAFAEEPALQGIAMELRIVHEDNDILVLDKPPGLLVHPVGGAGEATLAHGIMHYFQQAGLRANVHPVHRLDRNTSGLVLVAKSGFAHQALDRQLRDHAVRRSYLAFTTGVPEPREQVITAPIGPHPRLAHLRAVVTEGGDDAITRIRVAEVLDGAALLEVELETGRTHQIRVHLAHIGHPLLGDVQYGATPRADLGRQALHAASLTFQHPVTKTPLELHAPLPPDLEALRRSLGGGGAGRA